MTIFLISIIYPSISRKLIFDRHHAITISFSKGQLSRWIGPNQAVSDPSALISWTRKEKLDLLAAFFEREQQNIRSLSFTNQLYTKNGIYWLINLSTNLTESDRELLKNFGFDVKI